MKTYKYIILFLSLIFLQAKLYSNSWNTPDHGYFTCQEGIDGSVSTLSRATGMITYNGKLLHFINYAGEAYNNSIIIRTLQNESPDLSTLHFSYTMQENINNLNQLGNYQWQPAPVIFNNTLYLFFGIGFNHVGYSKYNSGAGTWSHSYPGPPGSTQGYYIGAAVVENKLCIVTQNDAGGTSIYWTKDLINWESLVTDINPYNGDYDKDKISAINRTYVENGQIKNKLMVAYLDADSHPHCADYKFDSDENLVKISNVMISTETTYSSVVLAEGSVFNDPTSSGNCLQAFLKLDSKDNGYCRYRIQRFQSVENGNWLKAEDNMFVQNYQWASGDLTLAAANFPVMQTDGSIRQFICLVYRSYKSGSRPLHCAFCASDYLVENPSGAMTMTLNKPSEVQYLGYIEGVPPYHLNNDTTGNTAPYLTPDCLHISQLEYTNSSTTTNQNSLAFDVGAKVASNIMGCKFEVAYAFSQKHDYEKSTKLQTSLSTFAGPESPGYYITIQSILSRSQYDVFDASRTHLLYPNYFFYFQMPPILINQKRATLQNGLDPSNPETYINRGINFNSYNPVGAVSNSWTTQMESSAMISVESSKSVTNTHKISITLGAELGELFEVEAEGSVEVEMESTTITGNEVTAFARLNEPNPDIPEDVTNLAYTMWWINNTSGSNNWWLFPGQDTSQNTWCITYEVNYLTYVSGDTVEGAPMGQFRPEATENNTGRGARLILQQPQLTTDKTETVLFPNYPNPFRNSTMIRYQIGELQGPNNLNIQQVPVTVFIYDMNGRRVSELVNELKAPGIYETEWDATNFAPGIYYCILQGQNFREVRKLMIR